MREAGPDSGALPGLASWRWNAAALAIFAAALAIVFGGVWRAGPRSFVPVADVLDVVQPVVRADVMFEIWLVARHARTLASEPWRLFDTEHCAPGEKTLTLGIPMITLGLLAMPATPFGDPILAYNFALLALLLASALAMYLLVTDWTGVPAAGIAAGLFFAFHPFRMGRIYHPTEFDIGWTALALFFARRLLASGRWRDAGGLALAGALQIAASFYPMLAGALLAVPLGIWLVRAYGLRRVRPAQLAFVVGATALAVAILLGPYLAARGAAPGHLARGVHFYAPWPEYLPGRTFFPGFALLGLAALGLAVPRRLGFPALARDPRLALCAAALLVAFLAGGPLGATILAPFGVGLDGPIPYKILASLLPGLETVRVVLRLVIGVVLVLALLAGAGVAACARRAGRFGLPVGAALAAAAALEVIAAPLLARGAGGLVRAESIRPYQESLDFFAALEAQGNRGAVLEIPYDSAERALGAPYRILVGAWHRRRTSACFGSYFLPEREQVAALAEAVPDPGALRELAALGFTTIVLHDPKSWWGVGMTRRFAAGTGRRHVRLRPIHATDTAVAYAIEVDRVPPPAHGAAPARRGRGG